MLSNTNTINDIKKELEIYTFYEYDTSTGFEEDISYCGEEIERFLKRRISPSFYTNIQLKDKIDLGFYIEEAIYYSEIYLICSSFLSLQDRIETSNQKAEYEAQSENGYTHSTHGSTGKAMAANLYWKKGLDSLSDAGYPISIKLGRNIFSNETWNYPVDFPNQSRM